MSWAWPRRPRIPGTEFNPAHAVRGLDLDVERKSWEKLTNRKIERLTRIFLNSPFTVKPVVVGVFPFNVLTLYSKTSFTDGCRVPEPSKNPLTFPNYDKLK